jgi:phospholipid/cholesterol/gamma-HCH transport system substrate-binding protein
MAQRKQITWSELRVGLFVLAGLFILAVGIFYVTGAGILGPKYRLYTYLPEVEGVAAGAPVRLDGVEIGNVEAIKLNPNPKDRSQSIQLIMRIDSKYKDEIRTSSAASLITEGLLGNRYVTITRGMTGQILKPNDTVPGTEEVALKAMLDRGTVLMDKLSVLSTDITSMAEDVRQGKGTVGKLINDPALYDHLNATAEHFDSVSGTLAKGNGSLGKLLTSDDLYNQAHETVSNLNDVLGAVKDQKGTVGKLVYDPAAYNSAKSFLDNGNAVLSDVRAGKGSLGKFANDDSLFNNLRDASSNVKDASAKLNSNTGTAGKLFNDPALYDNLTGLTGDLRLLVSDFRQDPKKYLRIRVTIF